MMHAKGKRLGKSIQKRYPGLSYLALKALMFGLHIYLTL